MIRYQRVRIYVESIEPWAYEDKVHRLLDDTYDRHPHKGQGQKHEQEEYKPLPEELILKGNKLEGIT